MTVHFTIPTKPIGKGRPRFSRYHKPYTPAKTKEYEDLIKLCYMEQCGKCFFGDKSIVMHVKAYVPIPTKFRKAEKEAARRGELRPITKPDADNMLKAILDALNEVAYDDDRYIYRLSIERVYSDDPHSEVTISDEE